ncbi:hypothetical protein C8Q75DRAFT_716042 [Abortiporus biennis]|nr:hypothetical protein C8Q75DRAFT_716042 [Abortiporus biennis]
MKGPVATANNNRLAMSKALGAAFLNHQVEQLEKSVSATGPRGNWRERRSTPSGKYDSSDRGSNYGAKHRSHPSGITIAKKSTQEIVAKDGGHKVEKDADIVVVDASVLIYGIGQLKRWCREGRQEVVIVPLEVLNTLDLLKKGTSNLAQRARTASRILEAQVGSNPRIRVQRDEAYIIWDNIPLKDIPAGSAVNASPEWVRCTISCARWELEHAKEEVSKPDPKVVLAVLPTPLDSLLDSAPGTTQVSASPVPLPAPQINRHEARASGTLVALWAPKAGIEVLELRSAEYGRRSPDDDRKKTQHPHPSNGGGRGRRNSHLRNDRGTTPPSGGLVERPPAVMAMMEMVSQPSRVVRVLARGEKLDPDP